MGRGAPRPVIGRGFATHWDIRGSEEKKAGTSEGRAPEDNSYKLSLLMIIVRMSSGRVEQEFGRKTTNEVRKNEWLWCFNAYSWISVFPLSNCLFGIGTLVEALRRKTYPCPLWADIVARRIRNVILEM